MPTHIFRAVAAWRLKGMAPTRSTTAFPAIVKILTKAAFVNRAHTNSANKAGKKKECALANASLGCRCNPAAGRKAGEGNRDSGSAPVRETSPETA